MKASKLYSSFLYLFACVDMLEIKSYNVNVGAMNSQIHFPQGVVKSKTVHFFRTFDDHTCDAKSLTLNS